MSIILSTQNKLNQINMEYIINLIVFLPHQKCQDFYLIILLQDEPFVCEKHQQIINLNLRLLKNFATGIEGKMMWNFIRSGPAAFLERVRSPFNHSQQRSGTYVQSGAYIFRKRQVYRLCKWIILFPPSLSPWKINCALTRREISITFLHFFP